MPAPCTSAIKQLTLQNISGHRFHSEKDIVIRPSHTTTLFGRGEQRASEDDGREEGDGSVDDANGLEADIYVPGQIYFKCLRSKVISRTHASIVWREAPALRPYVKDEGSTHGTFVLPAASQHKFTPETLDIMLASEHLQQVQHRPRKLQEDDILVFGRKVDKRYSDLYLPHAFTVSGAGECRWLIDARHGLGVGQV